MNPTPRGLDCRRCTSSHVSGRPLKELARRICRTIVIVFAVFAAAASADEELYRVNSKDAGWRMIDLTITETQRTERTSELTIPLNGKRTAVESRFAMCAFTDLAFRRKFPVWLVAAESLQGDHVVVGFLASQGEDAQTVLGESFTGDGVLKVVALTVYRQCRVTESPDE
jgi:hypothetical protein